MLRLERLSKVSEPVEYVWETERVYLYIGTSKAVCSTDNQAASIQA